MKVLKSWLSDYVKININDNELADSLTMSGTAVESIIKPLDDNIIVGLIKEILPHPNADRLQIAKVFTGIEDLQIVCGAPNIAIGQKVPLALIGTKLEDFEIKQAQIRGIESFGMMCSERELGIGEGHGGIKILPENFEIGDKLNKYFSNDTVFDLEITPNRGDCLSHLGVAREIAAANNYKLNIKEPKISIDQFNKQDFVYIEAKDLCKSYYAIKISGLKVGESPEWLKQRLNLLGVKSINNVVDITNYIMLDRNQPLHAFDFSKIDEKIIVRRSGEKEVVQTLDKIERKLPNETLVIADKQKVVAIAGVMGAGNSEVSQQTNVILLESAYFNPSSVRLTSKKLNLSTEASYRFERNIDHGATLKNALLAAEMILELCGGKIEWVSYDNQEMEPTKIKIEYEKINALWGIELAKNQIDDILISLGFKIVDAEVICPTYRNDLHVWQDLAEEVGRIYGLNNVKSIELKTSEPVVNSDFQSKSKFKTMMANLGFSETVNYVFLSLNDLKTAKLNQSELLEVANPIQQENKYLRSSLIVGLIKNIAKNPSFDPIALFEIGNVFNQKEEKTHLGVIASGKNSKNIIESAAELVGRYFDDKIEINTLNREELERFKIRKPVVYYFEIEYKSIKVSEDVCYEQSKSIDYKPVSKFPVLARDLAIVVSKDTKNQLIASEIYKNDKVLLVEIFDEFTSTKLGLDKKSLAFHIYFQDMDKALTDNEAQKLVSDILNSLKHQFKAEIRS